MKKKVALLVFLLVFLLFLDVSFGGTSLTLSDIWNLFFSTQKSNEAKRLIFWNLRFLRAMTAVFVGASLAVAGLILQTLFRNPLAGPYVLGISSGASFGVAVFVLFFSMLGFEFFSELYFSFFGILGSFAALIIILLIFKRVGNAVTVLIIGILLAGILNAMINFMLYFSAAENMKKFVVWSMGNFEFVDFKQFMLIFIVFILSFWVLFLNHKNLDLIYLDEISLTLGLNKKKIEFLIILISGILAGITTAFVGPIVFVGIISPHLARIYFETALHKDLILGSGLFGAIFLLFADFIAHLPLWNSVLPINTITSIIGIPIIFILVLKRPVMGMK